MDLLKKAHSKHNPEQASRRRTPGPAPGSSREGQPLASQAVSAAGLGGSGLGPPVTAAEDQQTGSRTACPHSNRQLPPGRLWASLGHHPLGFPICKQEITVLSF